MAARSTNAGNRGYSRWSISYIDETGSTNADLLDAAALGAPDGTVLVAAHQRAGRGRLDRRWDAPPGSNLLCSILFLQLPERLHELTWAVAVAAARACETVAGVRPDLKWPNDLLVDGRKLAGILAQTGRRPESPPGRIDYVVVGLGLNVGWAPDGCARLGSGVEIPTLVDALLGELDDIGALVGQYRSRLVTVGRDVRVELADGVVEGLAVEVTDSGQLVVETTGGRTSFSAGDVIHLRAAT